MTVAALPAGSRLLAEVFLPLLNEVNDRGLKGYAKRTSNSSGSTGTEVSVLRLDDVVVGALTDADRHILIDTTGLRITGGANDGVQVRLRATFDGSTPTTSSTVIAEASADIDDVGTYEAAVLSADYETFNSETISVLLTVQRISGTAGTASLGGASTYPTSIRIVDLGPFVGDTGTDL